MNIKHPLTSVPFIIGTIVTLNSWVGTLNCSAQNPLLNRIWGTYYGGTAGDRIIAMTPDKNGNLIVTGQTGSADSNAIATAAAHQPSFAGGGTDCFVAKFAPNGYRLWGTYLGGSQNEFGRAIAVDKDGYILVTGATGSSNGISTAGAHQPSFGGGATDAFLAKFDSSGILQWSTYYGGTNWERGYHVGTCSNGDIILLGETATSDSLASVIATPVSFQPVYGGGASDGFIAKFSPSGNRLWASYYGGNTEDHAHAVLIDSSNNIIFLGGTNDTMPAPSAIVTAAAWQTQNKGGEETYIAKFDANGNRLWGTYYGGNGEDEGYILSFAHDGNFILAGYTTSADSTNGISSANAHQKNNGGGKWDAFLAKFNSNGTRIWGTFYGGTGEDKGMGVTISANGEILLTGFTTTNNTGGIISTNNSWQPAYGGGNHDGFAAMFDSAGTRQWGTYYGGTGDDGFNTSAIGSQNKIYAAGFTTTSGGNASAVVTANVQQPAYGGTADGLIAKFFECIPFYPLLTVSDSTIFCSEDSAVIAVGNDFTSYLWNTGATTQTITLYSSDTVWATVKDSSNCSAISDTVIVSDIKNSIAFFTIDSINNSTVYFSDNSQNSNIWMWNCGDGSQSCGTPSHVYSANGTYTICLTTSNSCNTDTFCQQVNIAVGINEMSNTAHHFFVYPVLFSDAITIQTSMPGEIQVSVFDLLSREFYNEKFRMTTGQRYLSLNKLGRGVYILKISSGKNRFTTKIIKE